jgi:hypothetical protein
MPPAVDRAAAVKKTNVRSRAAAVVEHGVGDELTCEVLTSSSSSSCTSKEMRLQCATRRR